MGRMERLGMDGPKAQQASLAQQQQALKEREAKVGPPFEVEFPFDRDTN